MAAKTVAITGVSGRIGRLVARVLIDKGYTVHSIVKTREAVLELPAGTIPYLGNIHDKKILNSAFDGADAVLHLAAVVSEYKYTTKQILDTNVAGTRAVLDACNANGVKHLLFSSTVDVYGRARKENLTEESAMEPTDKYGYSKMLAEQIIKDERKSLDYTIFRIAAAYGPGFESTLFKLFNLIKGGKAYLVGNGENHLAIIHALDISSAFVLALENRKQSANKIYNISDGENHTQKELFGIAAEALKVPKPTKQISRIVMNLMAKTRNIDSDELRFLTSNRIIDISRAKKELGYKPKMDVREGVEQMVKLFMESSRQNHNAMSMDIQR